MTEKRLASDWVIDADVAMEVIGHEAVVRQAYKDSVGVWTWSVGITSKSGHRVNRYIDNPQPMSRCLEVFLWLLTTKYAPAVRIAFGDTPITKAQFTAALSFHWNTGAINSASWVKKFLAGDSRGARSGIMRWTHQKELIPRRLAERDLFFEEKWNRRSTITEYTKLTSRHTPVWKSGIQVDVSPMLARLLRRRR